VPCDAATFPITWLIAAAAGSMSVGTRWGSSREKTGRPRGPQNESAVDALRAGEHGEHRWSRRAATSRITATDRAQKCIQDTSTKKKNRQNKKKNKTHFKKKKTTAAVTPIDDRPDQHRRDYHRQQLREPDEPERPRPSA